MNIKQQNGRLTVDNVREISAANARILRDEVRAARSARLTHVDIDLSQVSSVDGYGLGALASLYAAANSQKGGEVLIIRLLHPQPPVQQLLELTRMHDIFEIVPNDDPTTDSQAATLQSNLSAVLL